MFFLRKAKQADIAPSVAIEGERLKAYRDIGDRFMLCGTELTVIAHEIRCPDGGRRHGLLCYYADKAGIFHSVTFEYDDVVAMVAAKERRREDLRKAEVIRAKVGGRPCYQVRLWTESMTGPFLRRYICVYPDCTFVCDDMNVMEDHCMRKGVHIHPTVPLSSEASA